jgi:hypothetical protein
VWRVEKAMAVVAGKAAAEHLQHLPSGFEGMKHAWEI